MHIVKDYLRFYLRVACLGTDFWFLQSWQDSVMWTFNCLVSERYYIVFWNIIPKTVYKVGITRDRNIS